MKKIILTIFTSTLCLMLLAQGDPTRGEEVVSVNNDFLRPGRMYLGGQLAFTGTSQKHKDTDLEIKEPKQSTIIVLPEFGYVLNDRFALALGLGYASSTTTSFEYNNGIQEDPTELKDKSGMFLIKPMFKSYKKISNRLYCMPSLGVTLGFGNSSNETLVSDEIFKSESSEFLWEAELRAALKFFPAEKWAISFSYGSLYYGSSTSTDKENSDHKNITTSYGLDLNLSSIRVGAYWFF